MWDFADIEACGLSILHIVLQQLFHTNFLNLLFLSPDGQVGNTLAQLSVNRGSILGQGDTWIITFVPFQCPGHFSEVHMNKP